MKSLLRLLLGVCFCAAGLARTQAAVVTISEAARDSISAAGGSFAPSFSEDGQFIVFLSHANNLVTNDDGGLALDVFLADTFGESMELISVNRSGTGGGDADSMYPLASRYGSMVVFGSRSSNLTTNDTDNAVDLFVRRNAFLGGVQTRLISGDRFGRSLATPVPYGPTPLSRNPALGRDVSPDVVFESLATNLVNLRDTNNAADVFSYDPDSGSMRPVSIARSLDSMGDGSSHSPQVSWPFVGFISTATNLHVMPPPGVATNQNRGGDIYVRDMSDGMTYWASPNTRNLLVGPFPAPPMTYSCFNFAVSGNGSVVYQANAEGSSSTVLLYSSRGAPNPTRITTHSDPVGRPQISYESVAYSSRSNIYLWNSLTGSNVLVSVNTNGVAANGPSHSPLLNRSGYVVFLSRATDLVTNAPSTGYQIYWRALPNGPTRLVTVNTNGAASHGDFELSNIAVPPEGVPAVAFDSTASDLVVGDLNDQSDVFIRNLARNETRLISRRYSALPAKTPTPLSGVGSAASVSADGRMVAFTSFDNPTVENDTNIWQDLFVRDTVSGNLQVVTSGPAASGFQAAVQPTVSASGTHVAYALMTGSVGPGWPTLHWRPLNGESHIIVDDSAFVPEFALSSTGALLVYRSRDGQIYLRGMPAGRTNLVSVHYSGSRPANNASSNLVLSPNDRWVVFQSAATDIVYFPPSEGGVAGPALPPGLLYARDLLANTSKIASITASNIVPVKGPAVFSDDSEWIGYVVTNGEIYVRQIANDFRTNVCALCDQPSLSRDASFVAYLTAEKNRPGQIYVKNMRSGVAKLISAGVSGGEGNGHSSAPQITADGRFVVFQSTASNLVENDRNNASDIFVGDRVLGQILLLSINRGGTGSGNGASSKAILSADGRTVVFQSLASDLIAGDYNDRRDVFVATLSLPDSDADGMDDDFEITYFGNLERDGAGDLDADGHIDKDEFSAGTNPTSDDSILRVISISAPASTTRQLVWSSTPGRTYVVQFKDALADSWSDLPGVVRATASTSAITDDRGGAHRFYRVVLAD